MGVRLRGPGQGMGGLIVGVLWLVVGRMRCVVSFFLMFPFLFLLVGLFVDTMSRNAEKNGRGIGRIEDGMMDWAFRGCGCRSSGFVYVVFRTWCLGSLNALC